MAAWPEQSSLQIWFMLSGIITVMLYAVSLALNVVFSSELGLGFIVACVVVEFYTMLVFVGLILTVHKGWQHIQLRSKAKVVQSFPKPVLLLSILRCSKAVGVNLVAVQALCILGYTACVFCGVIAVLWLVMGRFAEHSRKFACYRVSTGCVKC